MAVRPVRLDSKIPAATSEITALTTVRRENPHALAMVCCFMRTCPALTFRCSANAMPTNFSVGIKSVASMRRCMLSVSIHLSGAQLGLQRIHLALHLLAMHGAFTLTHASLDVFA